MAKNFWDDVKAPPTWSQLAGNPAFASLSVQEREAAKQQYFKDFIAPIARRNGDPMEYAWSVFSEGADAITTKLHSAALDNPPVPDAVRR